MKRKAKGNPEKRRRQAHSRREEAGKQERESRGKIFTLQVSLLEGPVTEEFAKRSPRVARTIQMRGSHTLADLHGAIFDALDREEEHLYEFQFGKGPHDPRAIRYTLHIEDPFPFPTSAPEPRDAQRTTLASLGLRVGQCFGYLFDFGDNWYHQIEVGSIRDPEPRARYPRVIASLGESPPQYADWEE